MKPDIEISEGSASNQALVVQGGGLRGAYAVGVLRALYDAGLGGGFERVIAVSSSVFAASYFAAGQVDEMENTWRDLVSGDQLVKYRNIFLRRPVMGLDYLVHLFKTRVRLNVDRVISKRSSLEFVLTDYATGEPAYFDAKRPDIFDLMRASSAIPRLYPIPVSIDGRGYYDGGTSDPIPVRRAISLGYKKILVILTRPLSQRKTPPSKLLAYFLLRSAPTARAGWMQMYRAYNDALDVIQCPPAGVQIQVVAPKVSIISRLTRKRSALRHAIEQGKKDAAQYTAGRNIEPDEPPTVEP